MTLRQLVRVETLKLRTLEIPRATLLVAGLLVTVLTFNAISGVELERPAPVTEGEGFRVLGEQPPTPTAALREDARDLLGTWSLVAFVAFALGVVASSVERRHGTLGASLLAVPRRHRLLVAKLGAVLPPALLATGLALAICLVLGGGWLRQNDVGTGLDAVAFAGDAALGVVACAVAAAIGVAVGILCATPATGIALGLGTALALEPAMATRDEDLARLLPFHAADAAFGRLGALTDDPVLPQLAGLGVLALWCGLAWIVALRWLDRRDVL